MTVTLDPKQAAWIGDRISEARSEAKKKLEAGIHNIAEARAAVEYDDFLNQLENDLAVEHAKNFMDELESTGKVKSENVYKIPDEQLSTEDIGAPVIPEINSTKDTDDSTTTISSAQEQMTEAQEKAMEDIFDL